MSVARDTARVALLAGLLAALAGALVVLLGVGEAVRTWYGLTPQRPVRISAPTLWEHNVRSLLPAFAAAAAVVWFPGARRLLDVALALLVAFNVVIVAVALGAYGRRLWELGPGHYPLELLAAAIAIAAYLDARRCARLRAGVMLACVVLCAVVLAVAAVLESAGAG